MKKLIFSRGKKNSFGLGARTEALGLILLLPAVASLVAFKYFPVMLGVFESFFKINIVKLPGEFIGLDNYIRAFTDTQFLGAFWHNVKFFLYGLVMHFWVPIVLAMLIDEVGKGKAFFRLGYFIPACTPGIAMSILWKYFWQPDYGLANFFITKLGFEAQTWLSNPDLVYFCMSFPGLVLCGGMSVVIYLAALQDVPRENYEAAIIDGASVIQRIRYITLPGIKHIVVLMLTLSIIGSLNSLEGVLIMTGGGPANSTQVMNLYAYQVGVNTMDYSYAMTMMTIVFALTMTLTVIFNKITKERD